VPHPSKETPKRNGIHDTTASPAAANPSLPTPFALTALPFHAKPPDNPNKPNLEAYMGRGLNDESTIESRREAHKLIQTLRQPSRAPTDPFSPTRIAEIQRTITVGQTCTPEQRTRVLDLIAKYADVFALKLSEVRPVKHVTHKIHVPADAKLPTQVKPLSLTIAERDWLHKHVDNLVEAGIVTPISYQDVRCANPIVLAPKEPKEARYTTEHLRILANIACSKAGVPIPHPNSPSDPDLVPPPPPTDISSWRLCNNFRALNNVTKMPTFPTADLATKQSKMAGHRYYNVIDLAAAYHACPIAKEDWGYMSFKVPDRGWFAWIRMPFGLTGAGNTAHEMINKAFNDMMGREVETQMDDICQAGDDWETLFSTLEKTLERCRSNGLSISPSKAVLFMEEVIWAGVQLSSRGMLPNPAKVAAILQWRTPSTALEVLSFLSTINFFRPSLHNFAIESKLLYATIRGIPREPAPRRRKARKGAYKDSLAATIITPQWTPEHDRTFALIKTMLTTAPCLRAPDHTRPFLVGADACKEGFGAFLCQHHPITAPDGTTQQVLHPIAFASRLNHKSERHLHSFALELAAIKFALEQFRKYIATANIILVTDCQAVKDMLENESMPATYMRWKEYILSHKIIDYIHLPGSKNPADGISRWAVLSQEAAFERLDSGWESVEGIINDVYVIEPDPAISALRSSFEDDPRYDIVAWLTDELPEAELSPEEINDIQRRSARYFIDNNRLWLLRPGYPTRVECLPKTAGYREMSKYHNETHWGRDIMVNEMCNKFDWPGMSSDAMNIISKCARCQAFGPRFINFLLRPIIRLRPFDMIAADYLKLPPGSGGYKEALIMVDYMTRWTWGFMLKKDGTSATSAESLENICIRYSTPKSLFTDNGPHFQGEELRAICDKFNILHETSPPYSPHCNGLVEVENKLLMKTLAKLCNEGPPPTAEPTITKKWPTYFAQAIHILNNRITPVLGTSPRSVMFGTIDDTTNLETLMELDPDIALHVKTVDAERDETAYHFTKHQMKRKEYFDKRTHPKSFEEGDLVLVYNERYFNDNNREAKLKLSPPWFGPLVVQERQRNSYFLKTLAGSVSIRRVHANRLKRFIPANDTDYTPTNNNPANPDNTQQLIDHKGEAEILDRMDSIHDTEDSDADDNSELSYLPFPYAEADNTPTSLEIPTQNTPDDEDDSPEDSNTQTPHIASRRPQRAAAINHKFIRAR